MSSQQFTQEIKQDIQSIRRQEQLGQQTVVTAEHKVLTDTQQSIATEIPVVTEKVVTKEYVPVTYEKVIQKIPVVVGQRVETGAPISQEKYVQALNVEYVQGAQQTKVDLLPQMFTQATGVQQVISQPLGMAAEKVSQQTFVEQQAGFGVGLGNQQFANQQFANQQFANQQFPNQQFANQQYQQQFLPQQQTTGTAVLEAQHLQPGQVYGQQGFVGQQPGLLGQQGFGQQGLLGQQQGFGQQGLLGQQQGFGQQGLVGEAGLLAAQGLQQKGFAGGLGQQTLGQNLNQKKYNMEADLTNIERNLEKKI